MVPEFLKRPLRHRSLLLRPAIIRELTRIAEDQPSFGNRSDVFHSGDALYDQMVKDILSAEERVYCEFYMFLSDLTSHRLAEALSTKAGEGVEVKLIYDSIGSLDAEESFFGKLRDVGVDVLEYRPIAPWKRRFGVFGRDHRKILVVDDRLGYAGGFNIADYWSESVRKEAAWRDTHVRLDGPAALDLAVLFSETWHRETGVLLTEAEPQEVMATHLPTDADDETHGGVLIVGGRGQYRKKVRRLYEVEIQKAETQLLLTNPYFIPDRAIRKELFKRAAAGVDVRLLLPEASDVPLADLAGRSLLSGFLKHGIRIFFYQGRILHAKSLVIDQSWATVGSSNFDSLSLNYNLEVNAVLLDVDVVKRIEGQFWKDLEHARELTLETWRQRPWKEKMQERLASLFTPWL